MQNHKAILYLALICICAFFANLDSLYPDIMEMRNFITAREMIQEGNWWSTTLNLAPRLEKPPLPTWLTAISVLSLGDLSNYYALRLPVAIISTLMVFFLFAYVKEISKNITLAFITASVFATSFLVVMQGRANSWDVYTHAFMIGSIWLFTKAVNNASWKPIFGATLLFGASVLSKGPVALYALFLPFIIALGIKDGKQLFSQHWPKLLTVIVLGLLIGFSWNIHLYFAQLEATQYVLAKETNSWVNRHVRSIVYYLNFPIFIGIWLIPLVATFFYKYSKSRINLKGNYKFLLSWLIAAIVLLSIVPTKKERYLLPALIPMALICGYLVHSIYINFKNKNLNKWDELILKIHSYIIGSALTLGSIVLLILKFREASILTLIGLLLIFIIGSLFLITIRRKEVVRIYQLTISTVLVFCCFLIPQISTWAYNNDTFNSLENLQSYKELTELPVFSEYPELDVRLTWLAGKPVFPLSKVDFSDDSQFPMVVLTMNPIHLLIPDSLENRFKIVDYGVHEQFRTKSKIKNTVNAVYLKDTLEN